VQNWLQCVEPSHVVQVWGKMCPSLIVTCAIVCLLRLPVRSTLPWLSQPKLLDKQDYGNDNEH
jgi:hypothetical protein